ncbi:N-acetyltransferase [Vibrio parahaemolyticus]|uniref:N-acetyltransferase n=2 Tax=Vibrio parahaemolyticus TaxID=670 RepID=A0A7Z2MUF2_VIBPH|nr:acyltransferase [Vibrio parahaemolyticus O1:Kuk str. FDA_R31]AMG06158.2 N-acetyltransferase [Vibrio parahaemolyticus]KIS83748.1 acyltransferase [Vibrio parahaemolyticus 97-10290]KIS88321.1 acyltransferase [Vibrio parahaemolyticus EN9701173]KIS91003.1 acyltransferase [Vibrio parahaemolyticus 12315]KIS96669.1 acyltransferase [Vibrio parahaemolyticus 846]KIT00605.1 acyltransferase [Vibrio parahaemolyticus 3324]KIT05244.1 acyltransferase [Vibrio parahaemolyticus EN9901310]KIT20090.1 acyltran
MTIPNSLIIEVLNPIKLPLIKKLYKAHYPSGRAKKDELIITASREGVIVALLRLKTVEQYRLLTGMLVIPEVRGTSVGRTLLEHCENKVFEDGDYCFAFSYLEKYYAQHGFETIDSHELPNSLKMAFQRYVDSGKDLIPMQFIPSKVSKRAL